MPSTAKPRLAGSARPGRAGKARVSRAPTSTTVTTAAERDVSEGADVWVAALLDGGDCAAEWLAGEADAAALLLRLGEDIELREAPSSASGVADGLAVVLGSGLGAPRVDPGLAVTLPVAPIVGLPVALELLCGAADVATSVAAEAVVAVPDAETVALIEADDDIDADSEAAGLPDPDTDASCVPVNDRVGVRDADAEVTCDELRLGLRDRLGGCEPLRVSVFDGDSVRVLVGEELGDADPLIEGDKLLVVLAESVVLCDRVRR